MPKAASQSSRYGKLRVEPLNVHDVWCVKKDAPFCKSDDGSLLGLKLGCNAKETVLGSKPLGGQLSSWSSTWERAGVSVQCLTFLCGDHDPVIVAPPFCHFENSVNADKYGDWLKKELEGWIQAGYFEYVVDVPSLVCPLSVTDMPEKPGGTMRNHILES